MLFFRTLVPVALSLAVAGLLLALSAQWLACAWLAVCFALFGLYHAGYLFHLHFWAALPANRDLPLGWGPWASVLDRMARASRTARETRLELQAELELIHAAVDKLPDGLAVLDRFNHVIWANGAAEELHGIFGRGRPLHHFIRQPEFLRYLEEGDFAKPVLLQLPSRPGRVFELRIHEASEQQKLVITRDVSDQAKLDSMRRDFVANVSHEIRTPVTVIGGFAETLMTLELDESSRHEYLGMILKHSQTMQRLVDDLLTLSSLENSTAPPAEENVDVAAMAMALAAEGRTLSAGKHVLHLNLESDARLRAAPQELESVLRNLITNAIRYTPEGGTITIGWSVRATGGWVSVQDTGIGIAAEHLPRITERFYRVSRDRSRETGGTGLGLAIVKHIAQRHQARLDIRSTLGVGSTFALQFPIERIVAGAPRSPDEPLEPMDLSA
jgi:two-component system, OmpR family, phosphate regulon sensor histidine kinase PhoR